MMSMRSLPSKYSPTNAPLVTARTTLATADETHALHRDYGQSVDVRALQVDVECAPAVEADVEHRRALDECLRVGQIDEHFVADDADHLLDTARVQRIDEKRIERTERRQVVATDVRLLFMLHVGLEAVDNGCRDFRLQHFDGAARRHVEKRVERVHGRLRKQVGFRNQQQYHEGGCAQNAGDPGAA